MNLEQKSGGIPQETMQTLADLGYSAQVRKELSSADIQKIINSNLTYTAYQSQREGLTQLGQQGEKQISEELKERYKQAYQALAEQIEVIELLDDSDRKALFYEVLKLGGNARSVEEVETFIDLHEERLSDEEIEFLRLKQEWLKA